MGHLTGIILNGFYFTGIVIGWNGVKILVQFLGVELFAFGYVPI